MKYKKGKPFESAVEMLEAIHKTNTVMDKYDNKFRYEELHTHDYINHYSSYYEAIEEKEDEVREFWNYYYLIGKVWSRTSNFYDSNYKNSSGVSSVILSKSEKTSKIESSKIRVRMSDLTIVEDE